MIWFNTEIKTFEPSDLSNYEDVKPGECLSKHIYCNKEYILSLKSLYVKLIMFYTQNIDPSVTTQTFESTPPQPPLDLLMDVDL